MDTESATNDDSNGKEATSLTSTELFLHPPKKAVNTANTFRTKITEASNIKKASVFNNVLYLLNSNGTFSLYNAVNYSFIGTFTLDSDYGIIAVAQN